MNGLKNPHIHDTQTTDTATNEKNEFMMDGSNLGLFLPPIHDTDHKPEKSGFIRLG